MRKNLRVLLLEDVEVREVQIKKLIGLGRNNDRNRPLLVKLRYEEAKREIMSNASRLRHPSGFQRYT